MTELFRCSVCGWIGVIDDDARLASNWVTDGLEVSVDNGETNAKRVYTKKPVCDLCLKSLQKRNSEEPE